MPVTKDIYKGPEARATMEAWFERFRSRLTVPTEARRVSTRTGETHVLVGGPEDAPPLVLLHGMLISSAHVLAEMEALLARFRVYAVDIIGQSVKSPGPPLSVANNEYGEWLGEVLDALSLPKAPVVGASFGGFVALRLAAIAPDRIEGMVLMMPAGVVRSSPAAWYKIAIPMTLYLMSGSAKRRAAFCKHMLSTPDDTWEEFMGDAFRAVHLGRVAIPKLARVGEFDGLEAPTLVLGAEQDLSFPGKPLLARMETLLSSPVETELMARCRHCPPTTDEFRGWLADRITSFLQPEDSRAERIGARRAPA